MRTHMTPSEELYYNQLPVPEAHPPMPAVKPPANAWRRWNYDEVPRDTILEGLWHGPVMGPYPAKQIKGWVRDDFYVQSRDDKAYSAIDISCEVRYPEYWRPQQGLPRCTE